MSKLRNSDFLRAVLLWILIFASLTVQATPVTNYLRSVAPQPSSTTKIFRGAIGDTHIQMSLTTTGDQLSGTYSYDRIRQDIKISGRLDQEGRLQLTEFNAAGKPAGKFQCKRKLGDPIDSECSWSRPDGSAERMVTLNEQHIAFSNGLSMIPKVIYNRKANLEVSYPQIVGATGSLAAAAQRFNRKISELVNQAIKDFGPEPAPAVTSFDTNYNIAFADNATVSIEMVEYSNSGGAHPNDRFWTLNYDLTANRELTLDDFFKAGSDYKLAIATYVADDINKRAEQIQQEDAKRDGREWKPGDDPLVSIEQLSEVEGFAITPKGLQIYFDFPHVMAFFDRTFVPYSVVSDKLQRAVPAN